VTDLLEADRWDTIYLGANVPGRAILETADEHRADLLVVSVTMPFHLPAVERLIALIRSSETGRELKVLVGGYPFNVDPELWRRVDADGSAADAREALRAADRLLGVPPRTGATPVPRAAGSAGARRQEPVRARGEVALYTELSRLNNELVTTQRELARRNARIERLNAQHVEADRRKDEFLAMLAHELRNPLAPLRNAAHLMQQPGVERPLIERAGEMMDRQVHQLGRLVDDLLDLSRIARGKMQLRRERVDVGQVIRRVAESSRAQVDARRHELSVLVPPVPVHLNADPTRLEQVLTNLLLNAVR
jgi:signal transduction histidine kinase